MRRPAVRRPAVDWAAVRRRLERLEAAVERGWEPTAGERAQILRARARALAEPPAAERVPGSVVEVIEFRLADEAYAVEAAHVAEVFPLAALTRLPCAPPFVRGIINVRGEIVSVVDLKRFFELPAHGISDLNKVILLRDEQLVFGILADRVEGTGWVAEAELQPALPTFGDRRRDYLKGIAAGTRVVLDVPRLLADPRLVVDEEVAE